jgi:four helix bundle protein
VKRPDRSDALEDLRLWHKALDLMVACHAVGKKLPSRENPRMRDQLERASSAIPALIAEGHGRARPKEILHSLDVARGELREVQNHLTSMVRLGYVSPDDVLTASGFAETVAQMMSGYSQSVLRRLKRDE